MVGAKMLYPLGIPQLGRPARQAMNLAVLKQALPVWTASALRPGDSN